MVDDNKVLNVNDLCNRPGKDLYFISLCFEIARMSIDTSSKCGCVIVSKTGGILSTGYNGPLRGACDEEITMERPEKYIYMEHSERNAIYNAANAGVSLKESTFYVTGLPCYDCLRGIVQVGSERLVYGPLGTVMQSDEEYYKPYKKLLTKQTISVERFLYDEGLFDFNPRIRDIVKGREQIDIRKYLWSEKLE
jgi:dCMP deaminase